jgi:hypothetical protein
VREQAGHIQLLCDDNHINKNNFISVQFVTEKDKVDYVWWTDGTDGTEY